MEPLFICEFKPTVKMIANRIRHHYLGRWILLMVILCGYAAYVVPSAIINLLLYQFDLTWVMLLLVGVIFPVYGVFFPEINAYFSVRRFKQDTDGEGVYRIAFGDVIEVRQGNIHVTWEYRDITQVEHLRYTYELKKNKRMALIVAPNSFTIGTFEEFKQFLRTKRPDLIIPE